MEEEFTELEDRFYESNETPFEDSDERELELEDEIVHLTPEKFSRFKIYDAGYMEEVKRGVVEVLANRFQVAEEIFKTKSEWSLYHLEAYQTMLFLKATMSFDQKDVALALTQLRNTSVICQKLRKRPGLLRQMTGWLAKSPRLAVFRRKPSHEESMAMNFCHVELVYAESLLLRAILTFISDEGFVNLVKSGINIRSAFMIYKSRWTELAALSNQSEIDEDYSSGVFLGIGAFNLMFSLLPPRVIKCFELLGFSGDRHFGLEQLKRGAMLEKGLRSPICTIFLLFFHIFVCNIMDLPGADLTTSKIMLDNMLRIHPDCSILHYFKGKISLIDRDPENASKHLNRSISSQTQWNALHHVCYWELCWRHASSGEWYQAAQYASKLLNESNWSKSFYSYMKAIFSYTYDKSDISHLMQDVEPNRQRIAGKSIPLEKFVGRKSRKYMLQGKRLFLPEFELLYVMNAMSFMRPMDVIQVIKIIEEALRLLDPGFAYFVDDQCLGYLLRGHLLRLSEEYDEAEKSLREVLNRETYILLDHYIAPWARYELSQVFIRLGRFKEAEEQLIYARDKYNHYSLESRLHFKLYSALSFLKT